MYVSKVTNISLSLMQNSDDLKVMFAHIMQKRRIFDVTHITRLTQRRLMFLNTSK